LTPKEFIDAVSPAAKKSAIETKIPASFTVAEAALESGWGVHAPGMNLFGIKADASWKGAFTTKKTREFVNGAPVMIEARFRAYQDWLGSIEDHAKFLLNNPRYAPAFSSTDGAGFARAVQACGYATDPNYAKTIISIIDNHNLSILDAQHD
jgi:flagellar rod assembly protein/muramidase FlgJ